MGTRGEIHTYIHTNKFLTRPTCQFASVDINFDDFFTFSAVTNTRGHNCTNCTVSVILVDSFSQSVL